MVRIYFIMGEELLHATLPKELQREVADSLTRYHIDGVLEGQETAYFRRDYWMPVVKSIFEENGTFSAKMPVVLGGCRFEF